MCATKSATFFYSTSSSPTRPPTQWKRYIYIYIPFRWCIFFISPRTRGNFIYILHICPEFGAFSPYICRYMPWVGDYIQQYSPELGIYVILTALLEYWKLSSRGFLWIEPCLHAPCYCGCHHSQRQVIVGLVKCHTEHLDTTSIVTFASWDTGH